MSDLLPATQGLLIELLEGLDRADEHLPELRVGQPGRSGARYWLYGRTNRSFPGRRPTAQFEELRSAGLIRKLRQGSAGTYFAFTSEAFDVRDRLTTQPTAPAQRTRPTVPAPELDRVVSHRDVLLQLAGEARSALGELASKSAIRTFRNDPHSGVFYVPKNPYSWLPLEPTDAPLLAAARAASNAWFAAARHVIGVSAPEYLTDFDDDAELLRTIYDRSGSSAGPRAGTAAALVEGLDASLNRQLAIIDTLAPADEPDDLFLVPDTNALLQDPAIEDWVLGDQPVCFLIAQAVVAELDAKKVDGNVHVRPKAEKVIRRLKEYGRRGDTLRGVKVSEGRTLRELAFAPDMSLYPNLDAEHFDDRILATALTTAATHMRSRVVLVTRDRNFQNKARFFGLTALDVSDV